MSKILIVEDDEYKATSLKQYILETKNSSIVTIANNLYEAIKFLNRNIFDLILIDMAIPSHPIKPGEGAPRSLLNGGLEILLELNYTNSKTPCVVITQYPDIEISEVFYSIKNATNVIKTEFYSNTLACIEYREGDDSWKNLLTKTLEKYEDTNS